MELLTRNHDGKAASGDWGRRILKGVGAANRAVIAVLILGLALLVNGEVLLRYFFNLPLSQIVEYTQTAFIWASSLGAASAVAFGTHLAVDILAHRVTGRGRVVLRVISAAAALAFGVLLTYHGFEYLQLVREEHLVVTQLPVGIQAAALPCAGLVMAFYGVLMLLQVFRPDGGTPDSEEIFGVHKDGNLI